MIPITARERARLALDIDYSDLPQHLHTGMVMYMEEGLPPGGFLQHVIANDLREAVGRVHGSDEDAGRLLRSVVTWLNTHAPAPSWGSPLALAQWIDPERYRSIEVRAADELVKETGVVS